MRIRLECNVVTAGLLLAGTAFAQSGAYPALLKAPWRAFNAGAFPTFTVTALAYGDIDGDLDLDVLTGRDYFGGPGLSVLRSNGNGTFEAPENYDTAYNQSIGEVALTDMDFDGDLDAVATVPDTFGQTRLVMVWRNDGSGRFGQRQQFTTGAGPVGLVVADFTGDGIEDLLTANAGYLSQGNTVCVLPHNGLTGSQAGYLAPISSPSVRGPLRVSAADIDGDLDLDIAAGSGFGVRVHRNDGTGRFDAGVSFEGAPGEYAQSPEVLLLDVNSDESPDLITGGAFNEFLAYGIVVVRLNDGAGNFGAPTRFNLVDWTFTPSSFTAADLNGDPHPDLIVTTPSGRASDGYSILLGDGAGGFSVGDLQQAAKQTIEAISFDVDGDRINDIITGANDSSVITVHHNQGDGTVFVLPKYLVGSLTRDMDAGDLDLDFDLDIVTTDSDARILRNDGTGVFAKAEVLDLPQSANALKLRDLNNDGYLDFIASTDFPPYNVMTALNNGDGTFGQVITIPFGASQTGDVEAFDLDNDTLLDVVMTDPGPAAVIRFARNLGDGRSFQIVPSLRTAGLPQLVDGADINNDGNIDLVTNIALGLTVYTGNGDFTFGGELATGVIATQFVLTDFNNDQEHDIALLLQQDSFGTVEVATMIGYGDGSFAFPTIYEGPSGREGAFVISSDVDAADVDGDQRIDFVLTSNAPNDIALYRGNGDGTLRTIDRYGAGYSARRACIGDFTGDGRADVAVLVSAPPSGLQNAVVVLEQNDLGDPIIRLDQTPIRRGEPVTLHVSGANPGEQVNFLYSLAGVGDGPCPPQLGGLCIDLLSPVAVLGSAVANGEGVAELRRTVPAQAPLEAIYTQAVVRRGGGGADSVRSNTVRSRILP